MTSKQRQAYLKNSHKCPYCGGADISGRGYDYDEPPARIIDCENCGKSWMDVFTLTDVLELDADERPILGEIMTPSAEDNPLL